MVRNKPRLSGTGPETNSTYSWFNLHHHTTRLTEAYCKYLQSKMRCFGRFSKNWKFTFLYAVFAIDKRAKLYSNLLWWWWCESWQLISGWSWRNRIRKWYIRGSWNVATRTDEDEKKREKYIYVSYKSLRCT